MYRFFLYYIFLQNHIVIEKGKQYCTVHRVQYIHSTHLYSTGTYIYAVLNQAKNVFCVLSEVLNLLNFFPKVLITFIPPPPLECINITSEQKMKINFKYETICNRFTNKN